VRRTRRRRGHSRQTAEGPEQLSLDFDQPTPVEVVDPGGAPLPIKPVEPGPAEQSAVAGDFELPAEPTVPSGVRSRAEANLAALEVLRVLEAEGRPATLDEQQVLAAWSSWGALPQVFEDDPAWDGVRTRLRDLLTDDELAAARTTVLNAHYTDPAVVRQTWRAVTELGFTGGRVLEPGCGSGNFIGHAPASAEMVGVELDPITARIAAVLYSSANIRTEGFEHTRLPEASFVAAVGNVPFGGFALFDPDYNPGGHHIHDHFIVKALRLTAPGGVVAVVTSAGTLDKRNPAARWEMHTYGDLVGAVRLPSGAMARTAGTDVVCDLVILRRRRDGEAPGDLAAWERAVEVITDTGSVTVNRWFAVHPELVLGTLEWGEGCTGRMRCGCGRTGATWRPRSALPSTPSSPTRVPVACCWTRVQATNGRLRRPPRPSWWSGNVPRNRARSPPPRPAGSPATPSTAAG
jgi:SAM-dependent methyltransferase